MFDGSWSRSSYQARRSAVSMACPFLAHSRAARRKGAGFPVIVSAPKPAPLQSRLLRRCHANVLSDEYWRLSAAKTIVTACLAADKRGLTQIRGVNLSSNSVKRPFRPATVRERAATSHNACGCHARRSIQRCATSLVGFMSGHPNIRVNPRLSAAKNFRNWFVESLINAD